MRNSWRHKPKGRKRKFTLLVALVVFVFFVLFISVLLAGGSMLLMNRFGLIQPITTSRLPIALLFLLVSSLFIAMIITTLAGNISLRPLKKFIDATKEIAAGNFSVRVESHGPEEYERLVTSFNEMAEELGSIETLRDDFVSSISHEYKTPIVSIRGFAKLIKKGNLTAAQQEEYLDIIIAESDRLAQLSSNVLLLSKLNAAGRPEEGEDFYLDEQLRRVIVILNQQAENKRIDLEIELEACAITANQELLQQAWMNLLHNAIKFTPEGGTVAVRLENRTNQVRVTIRDTGVGMSPDTVKHAFDKFYQGDRSRSGDGNGLGLSLVKRIVELYDGTVTVQSEEGKGSLFTVTLPKSGR